MTSQTVGQIMTVNPQCCAPQDTIAAAARQMAAGNFGAVPVADPQTHRLLGVITDRDITCRITAEGADPTRARVSEGMSQNVAALGPEASLQECIGLMEKRQVRRVPIVDARGIVVGIVALADLARATEHEQTPEHTLAKMVEEISAPQHVLTAG